MGGTFTLEWGKGRREVGGFIQIIVLGENASLTQKKKQKKTTTSLFYFLTCSALNQPVVTPVDAHSPASRNERGLSCALPPRVIYIHNGALSCAQTAGMGSSAGHESSTQWRDNKEKQKQKQKNRESRYFIHTVIIIIIITVQVLQPRLVTQEEQRAERKLLIV